MNEILAALGSARAVLFDVDGTLYVQSRVRRAMLARLARSHIRRPLEGVRAMRILSAYRSAQEAMRGSAFVGDVATEQFRRASESAHCTSDEVRRLVEEWMENAPLDALAANARAGLVEALDELAARGIRLGVVSDYPAERKLAALGLAGRFDIVLSAQDSRVQSFKPSPTGLLVALSDLGVAPADTIYVGDRPDVDGAAARAANMRFLLVGGGPRQGAIGSRLAGESVLALEEAP